MVYIQEYNKTTTYELEMDQNHNENVDKWLNNTSHT